MDGPFRTAVPHIYAVGDVIGFPSLAATSMEQGRLARTARIRRTRATRCASCSRSGSTRSPRSASSARPRRARRATAIPYEVGISRYRELARGQILGDSHGMLKLLVHADDRRLLGVHAIGTGATELIHIGQAVMALGGTDRLPRRHRLQLPDAGRELQGRGARRVEQDGRARPHQRGRLRRSLGSRTWRRRIPWRSQERCLRASGRSARPRWSAPSRSRPTSAPGSRSSTRCAPPCSRSVSASSPEHRRRSSPTRTTSRSSTPPGARRTATRRRSSTATTSRTGPRSSSSTRPTPRRCSRSTEPTSAPAGPRRSAPR